MKHLTAALALFAVFALCTPLSQANADVPDDPCSQLEVSESPPPVLVATPADAESHAYKCVNAASGTVLQPTRQVQSWEEPSGLHSAVLVSLLAQRTNNHLPGLGFDNPRAAYASGTVPACLDVHVGLAGLQRPG